MRENVSTTAENEMSVVSYGEMDDNFLLTGDAGIRALDKSITYSEEIGKSIKDTVNFIQVPHHGGRHNVSPSILNRLLGEIVEEENYTGNVAFVSVANDSDQPLQMVVNAFTRRVENKIIFTDGKAPMPEKVLDAIWIVFGGKQIHPKGGKVINITIEQLNKLYSYDINSSSRGRLR